MKKILITLLFAALIVQAGAAAVFAKSTENEKQIITISNIDAMQIAEGSKGSSTEIKAKGLRSKDIEIVSEDWNKICEFVISRDNVSIKDGKYSYRLVIRTNGTLTFDNDLEIYYQGVNGRYKLHYDIDETDDHTMIVTGVFDNIIVASPLLDKLSAEDREWILAHISKDSYFYELFLKTKEGFSFQNTLQFLLDARKYGYSIKYTYDLLTNKQTLVITDISDESNAEANSETTSQTAPVTANQQKAVNPLAVKGKIAGIKYKDLKNKTQILSIGDVIRFVKNGQGKITYTKASGNKKIAVNKNTGKITVKKGLKKGTYKVKVKVRASGNEQYKASPDKTVTFKIKVR